MSESRAEANSIRAGLARRAREGGRIGIALGTFALIHAGTVRFLRRARAECDCLFAAILPDFEGETDKSGSDGKGQGSEEPSGKKPDAEGKGGAGSDSPAAKPVLLSLDERRRVLLALREVDGAEIVEDLPAKAEEWHRAAPGAVWMISETEDDVSRETEAELKRLGARTMRLGDPEGCSTQEILERIAR